MEYSPSHHLHIASRKTKGRRNQMVLLVMLFFAALFIWTELIMQERPTCSTYSVEPKVNVAEYNTGDEAGITSHSSEMRRSSEPRLGDGCQHVFLDVGANIGVHTRFLFESSKYPKATMAKGLYNRVFGSQRDNRDLCSFGFEPNPIHRDRHMMLEQAYRKMGWRYTFVHAGAGDIDGNLTFWHQGGTNPENEEWGFSLARNGGENAVAETVPLIHLSNWIQYHIAERELPDRVHGKYADSEGKVVMKLDIEGSEYMVLPSLMFSGVLCRAIDLAFGESHTEMAQRISRDPLDAKTKRGEIKFESEEDATQWVDVLVFKAFQSLRPENCKATYLDLDDEVYLHDGVPFPKT